MMYKQGYDNEQVSNVIKYYDMQLNYINRLQVTLAKKGIVWLGIILAAQCLNSKATFLIMGMYIFDVIVLIQKYDLKYGIKEIIKRIKRRREIRKRVKRRNRRG